jgi:succinate dehydrogenase/fumarate reductase flavoprotein subunit
MARILTGIQSSGRPHLGNLLGAIIPAIKLSQQAGNESFFFIADLHSLTTIKDAKVRQENTRAVAAAWLAFGFDIEKNVLWKKGEEVNGTIVAVVQRVYDESKRAGRINDEAQKIYDDLGNVMARNVKNVRNGGGIRLAKPNKENFLKEISKFAKISTRVKDWNK